MQAEQLLRFGPYRLDLGATQLWRGTLEVKLTPKALAVLRVLVTRPGQVVTKDEFFRSVWTETVVSDDARAACIQELRQALREEARKPRYLETLHRRGYRFIAPSRLPPLQFQVPSFKCKVPSLSQHLTPNTWHPPWWVVRRNSRISQYLRQK
jgi:DNA-binding winged helix-turn-helix (wHTH) protein